MMLLAEGLVRALELWDQGKIDQLPDNLMRDRLPVTLIQILNRTLMSETPAETQNPEQHLESIAYAVLTLKTLSSLPWLSSLTEVVLTSIEQSQQLLRDCRDSWNKPQYLWVEKVTYGSPSLAGAYYLAAVQKIKQSHPWTDKVKHLVQVPEKETKKINHLFTKLHCFQNKPAWKIQASVLEGLVFLQQLKVSQANVLAGQQPGKNEYLSFIPCSWVVVNNLEGLFLDTYLLWDMMTLTLGNFRVDEYMETTLANLSAHDIEDAKALIETLCQEPNRKRKSPSSPSDATRATPAKKSLIANGHAMTNGHDPTLSTTPPPPPPTTTTLSTIHATLAPYIHTLLTHPRIRPAPANTLHTLRTTLATFLSSHLSQSQHNKNFTTQTPPPSSTPTSLTPLYQTTTPFPTYMSTTAAPSVSALFSFAYLSCLLGGLPDPLTRHIGTEFATRVAVMSRLYNDLGSMARDRAEGNVNCVNFREFHGNGDGGGEECDGVEAVKGRVERVARFEREAVGWVGGRLAGELEGRRGGVRLFGGVAGLYADVYVVRDLSNRVAGGV